MHPCNLTRPPETPDGLHRCWWFRALQQPGNLWRQTPLCIALWVMLNPSTADANTDDPTSTRVRRFSADESFSHVLIGNLYTRRATDPADLHPEYPDANLPEANEILLELAGCADAIVLAWGAANALKGESVPAFKRRAVEVAELMIATGKPLYALGRTKSGQPLHPLMASTQLARIHPPNIYR